MAHLIWLHGFGSSPQATQKGVRLRDELPWSSVTIPDLEAGDFEHLTMDLWIQRAKNAVAALPQDGVPLVLAGSSLGAYTAALIASQGIIQERSYALLLVAPAFGFTGRWSALLGPKGIEEWRRTSWRTFDHKVHVQRRLHVGFLDSCMNLPQFPAPVSVPVSILHGRHDQTADWKLALEWSVLCPRGEFCLLEGAHGISGEGHLTSLGFSARRLVARLEGLDERDR